MEFNETFLNNMQSLLGAEYEAYIKALHQSKHKGIRVNTLKTDKGSLVDRLSYTIGDVPWCDQGLYCEADARPGKDVYHTAGLFYIQEPSAMIVGTVANIQKGDYVLDLCAAPGGKSTQIACQLAGTGLLVSNDLSASRAKAITKNIEQMGITNAIVTAETAERLGKKFPKFFDKVIIDAPCSGEGMFKHHSDVVKSWTEESNQSFATIQRSILQQAVALVADGGVIVYSTCTFSPVENEEIIKEFLTNNTDFEIKPIDHEALQIEQGINIDQQHHNPYAGCGRIFPHKQQGEGHFVCVLKNTKAKVERQSVDEKPTLDKQLQSYYDFCKEHLTIVPQGHFVKVEDGLSIAPDGITDTKGLRVLKSGFYLGELKNKRFEPSQALAMALRMEDAKRAINYCVTDRTIEMYLKGESFEVDCEDGYALVCVEGFPLGFGKVVRGRLKNKYSKSWMIER